MTVSLTDSLLHHADWVAEVFKTCWYITDDTSDVWFMCFAACRRCSLMALPWWANLKIETWRHFQICKWLRYIQSISPMKIWHSKRKEFGVFSELLKLIPSLKSWLLSLGEEEVVAMAELVSPWLANKRSAASSIPQIQWGTNSARADNTKGMKCTIIDWITPKGQTLNPHIPHNAKSTQGFNHECTGALLCPAGYNWSNME